MVVKRITLLHTVVSLGLLLQNLLVMWLRILLKVMAKLWMLWEGQPSLI